MINMDAPKHTKLRLIVNRGFTPRQVARIDDSVRKQAKEIVDRVARDGRVRLRHRDRGGAAAADHLRHDGHPASRARSRSSSYTNIILGVGDPEYVQTHGTAHGRGHGPVPVRHRARAGPARQPARRHHDARSCTPRSKTRRKHRLTTGELGSFFLLLVVAGNETTRNAISHGMLALTDNPDQRKRLDLRLRRGLAHRGRGDRALGDARHPLPPHRATATPWSAARRSRKARRS